MKKERAVTVKGAVISVMEIREQDYISLTDMVRNYEDGLSLIEKWLRNKNTLEFLGIWEKINNSDFNSPEFEGIMLKAGLNRFTLSVKKWTEKVKGIGIIAKAGRYGGGTYAHKDIAFEFGAWLSPEFKLYLIKEFQRLKDEENKRLKLGWSLQRELAKINYRIHTDAIKEELIPDVIGKKQALRVYANEADMLNAALFGMTAAEWRKKNPGKDGNIRDYAAIEQLVVLSNLESINSMLVRQGVSQKKRLMKLNEMAIMQMKSLLKNENIKKLK